MGIGTETDLIKLVGQEIGMAIPDGQNPWGNGVLDKHAIGGFHLNLYQWLRLCRNRVRDPAMRTL